MMVKHNKMNKAFLGRGGFGYVKSSICTNKKAAMKIFSKKSDNDRDRGEHRDNIDSVKEITSYVLLDAPWIPKYYGIFFCEGKNKLNVGLVSSHVKGRKLSHCYRDFLENYPHKIYEIFEEICGVITFLHQRNIFHGDLSHNNVLVDFDKRTDKLKISLIDYGMSGIIEIDSVVGMTVDFAAYEILTHEFKDKSKSKVDIFSLGCIIFNIVYRTSFINLMLSEFKKNHRNPPLASSFKEQVKKLYFTLMEKDIFDSFVEECLDSLPENNFVNADVLEIMKKWFKFDPDLRPEAIEVFNVFKKAREEANMQHPILI